jgi:hypothetical protein
MPSIIDDFKAIHDAARLLSGADLPMNTAQPMTVDWSHMKPIDDDVVLVPSDYDYGC